MHLKDNVYNLYIKTSTSSDEADQFKIGSACLSACWEWDIDLSVQTWWKPN